MKRYYHSMLIQLDELLGGFAHTSKLFVGPRNYCCYFLALRLKIPPGPQGGECIIIVKIVPQFQRAPFTCIIFTFDGRLNFEF